MIEQQEMMAKSTSVYGLLCLAKLGSIMIELRERMAKSASVYGCLCLAKLGSIMIEQWEMMAKSTLFMVVFAWQSWDHS